MDPLNKFTQAKEELRVIQKALFLMFEENDIFGIIRQDELTYMEFVDHRHDDTKVIIELYNYRDTVPRITFEADRAASLACDETTITMWIEASKNIVERAMAAKAKKFLKTFSSEDFQLISLVINAHDPLAKAGKSQDEIATTVAKSLIAHLSNKKLN